MRCTAACPILILASVAFGNEDTYLTAVDVFEKVAPSVVFVTSSNRHGRATGSGYVWDETGHVVTNYHVIEGATKVTVTVATPVYDANGDHTLKRDEYESEVVGTDSANDCAVLRVHGPSNTFLPIEKGRFHGIKIGEPVYAVGNPFGLDHSMSAGIVSGLKREMKSRLNRPIFDVIQTDAHINPGNSGGALVDGHGKIIGMTTATLSTTNSSAGVGFVVPLPKITRSVQSILVSGAVTRAGLGIEVMPSVLSPDSNIGTGVLVLQVDEDSTAYKAGLRGSNDLKDGVPVGDIILRIDDIVIHRDVDLYDALKEYDVGDTVKITVKKYGSSEFVVLEYTLVSI